MQENAKSQCKAKYNTKERGDAVQDECAAADKSTGSERRHKIQER
jgi:hypothetical protein